MTIETFNPFDTVDIAVREDASYAIKVANQSLVLTKEEALNLTHALICYNRYAPLTPAQLNEERERMKVLDTKRAENSIDLDERKRRYDSTPYLKLRISESSSVGFWDKMIKWGRDYPSLEVKLSDDSGTHLSLEIPPTLVSYIGELLLQESYKYILPKEEVERLEGYERANHQEISRADTH